MNKKDLEWKRIEEKQIIKNQWIDLRETAYRFPDGTIGRPFYNISRQNYVVIVASDENGRYLCVHQYRHGLGKVTTEFPAGGIESGETLEQAARRELKEETGYESDSWQYLLAVPSYATIADNYAYIFKAENCRKVSRQHLDDTEFLQVSTCTDEQLQNMTQEGHFEQAIHILAWLWARNSM
ncbi:NUDIX hydrolase [Catenisphaera adipataccumulans]|uniref:ADP-ribose pyrophosphatase n=1 Tax=Catenisphaera adipataccumulans TaxID=700500 RepID=A0A7W8CW70_9FIRM|nr:NUDIX hydrolase [Catenisphaera adipataccumulans]MBB5182084.1 ADP-ribose pyrophosphatase [Catenisphaera adipataccumulans]